MSSRTLSESRLAFRRLIRSIKRYNERFYSSMAAVACTVSLGGGGGGHKVSQQEAVRR